MEGRMNATEYARKQAVPAERKRVAGGGHNTGVGCRDKSNNRGDADNPESQPAPGRREAL